MAAPVTKLQPVKLPTGPSPVSLEQQYWNQFRSPHLVPSPSAYSVSHIASPTLSTNSLRLVSTHCFAVTAGARVQIFSSRTRKLLKQITRFKDVAHSGEIRRDGRVLVAGDEAGLIQVFDINSRAILKTWEVHKQPVWTTKFSPSDLTTLMSASDDKTVRIWDLPSQDPVTTFTGHEDYVRSGAFMPGSAAGLLISGSYDETVRLWDPRSPGRSAMVFKHGAPVEDVLPMPSGTTVLASADNKISILDLVAGKPLRLLKNHQKTVTSLCLASNGTRLLSGGLDRHVKVFETTGWNVVAGLKYPSPILSLSVISVGADREDKHLAVGMQSGTLSIRTRLSGQQKVKEKAREKEMQALVAGNIEELDRKNAKQRPRGLEKKLRGRDFTGEGADIIIEGNDRGKVKPESQWEAALRKGRYSTALDMVLIPMKHQVNSVVTLLVALRHRSAMRVALQDRDQVSLQPILKWVTKYIRDPNYVDICVEVALLIFDIYGANMGMSPDIDDLVKDMHRRVRKEVERAQQACQTRGMLSMLTSSGQ